jgi:hypothetical protein
MRISVFGIGYVGAVSSACLADIGHEVIGVDVAPAKIDLLKRGQSPIVEASVDTLIADAVARGTLTATVNGAAAVAATELSLICVGTPSAADGSVALNAVDAVIAEIGAAIAGKQRRAERGRCGDRRDRRGDCREGRTAQRRHALHVAAWNGGGTDHSGARVSVRPPHR